MNLQLRLISIYLSVFLLSLIATSNLNHYIAYSSSTISNSFMYGGESYSWIYIFLAILFGALVMYIIVKSPFRGAMVKLVELSVVFVAVWFLSYSFFVFLESYSESIALLFAMVAVLLRMRGMYRNEIAALSTAGVASILGFSMGPVSSLLLMAALSVYDYIAVFKTKHMQVLAEGLRKEETAFSIRETRKRIIEGVEKEEFMEIGTGDVLVPALIANSFSTVNLGYSFFVILGTFFGFGILVFTLKRYKKMLPALPFLFVGIILSLLFALIIDSAITYFYL